MKLNIKKTISTKPNTFYKWSGKKTVIIAVIVLFSLALPKIVLAINIGAIFSNAAIDLLYRLIELIFGFLAFLVRAGAAFFEGMLNAGFKSHLETVKTGWTITRDFSNMFFILFMVIIAFATILRFERYGIKKLLPKVIGVALLINFSLVLCSVVIDFSNITANFFIDNMQQYAGKGGISGTFSDSLNVSKNFFGFDCEKQYKERVEICNGLEKENDKNLCNKEAERQKGVCEKAVKEMQKAKESGWATVRSLLISAIFGSIVLFIAAFTFFVGGVLLLGRIVIIWFLVMIVPLALLCLIMPALYNNWKKWLNTFLSWCFFAPAYAFFVWLAFKVAIENKNKQLAAGVHGSFVNAGPGANPFLTNPGEQLISYAFIIALLIGGLIAAKSLGIYGAKTAISIGQKWGKGAGSWAKRTGMRPVKTAGRTVGAGALTAGSALFGGTKLGRRMKARAIQIRRKPEEYPQHKRYAALLKTMSNPDAIKEMMAKAITPDQRVRKLLATREVAGRGLLKTATKREAREAMKTLNKFRDFESLEKLKETRADAIIDATEQENIIQKITQEGNLNKIPAVALKDERLISAISKFASATQIESLGKVSPQHGDELKDTLEKITNPANSAAMISAGIQPLADKIQHAYASQKGDVTRMSTAQKIDWAKKAGPEGLKRMTTFDADIAVNIPTAQLKNALEKMFNATVTKDIVAHLKATPAAAAHDLATHDPYISNLG
jgi:hypothetical protein